MIAVLHTQTHTHIHTHPYKTQLGGQMTTQIKRETQELMLYLIV